MASAVFNARVHEYDFSFVPSELDALKKQQRVLCEKFKEDKGGQFRFTQFFGFLILLATDQCDGKWQNLVSENEKLLAEFEPYSDIGVEIQRFLLVNGLNWGTVIEIITCSHLGKQGHITQE